MEKDIIFENKEFKVVGYEKGDEPVNIAITIPKNGNGSRYSMLNGVDIKINNPWTWNKPIKIEFHYKSIIIEERKLGTIVSLCDLMNHYYNLSKNDLDVLLKTVQERVKSDLENEIELLVIKKNDLNQHLEELEKYFEKFSTETRAIINEMKK